MNKPERKSSSSRATKFAQKDVRVDKLHYLCHSTDPDKVTSLKAKNYAAYCRDNCNPSDHPTSKRENSIVCEEEFRHTAKLKYSFKYMKHGTFCLHLFSIQDARNYRKIKSGKFKAAALRLDSGLKPKMNKGKKVKGGSGSKAMLDLSTSCNVGNEPTRTGLKIS